MLIHVRITPFLSAQNFMQKNPAPPPSDAGRRFAALNQHRGGLRVQYVICASFLKIRFAVFVEV